MPRKALPRLFKLTCKYYRGFDRHFTAKAIATRKFHTGQGGVYINHKLAAAPDYKHGQKTGRPFVRSYSTSYPSFAAQPLAVRPATARLPPFPQASASRLEPRPLAPSFAAAPVMREQQAVEQPSVRPSKPEATSRQDRPHAPASASPQLQTDPLYQYANLNQKNSGHRAAKREQSTNKKQDRSAMRWYGGLDKRPISKASTSSSHTSSQNEHARLQAAFSAYADLSHPQQ